LRAYAPTVVITSVERKADQTGAIVAQKLGIPATVLEGFHEHERDKAGPASREAFEAMLARFFVQPSKLLFGCETAEQALQRFSGAMATVLARYPSENVAIVSHGTVITLWVTSLIGGDPFVFWKGLGMPSFVVFSKPDLKLVELVRYVE
jgi:broad specificity phosphatase PhoE